MIFKKSVKNGYFKSRNLSEKKHPTPSTNIPLLSYRNSEQLEDTKLHTISKIQTKLLVSRRSPERSDCL